ncbi:MAG: polysaccharide deacetylase family protein [Jatrophihabitans sp.]|uniref:polysaccharide deacetylase family protein n=1 Tax=Jatrophihabitans sp. TaxID=1932789 RepID=UPI003914C84E
MSSRRPSLASRLGVAALLPLAGLAILPIQPAGAVTACPGAGYGVHRSAPAITAKTVALTFDDGPGRDTGRIMTILAANHVTATFFNLGVNEARLPSTVRSEQSYGFALGDHTWDHASLPLLSRTGQASEMDRERAEQAGITGAEPCLFRPPYGNYNADTLQLAQSRGMWVWNWSVDTEDWKAAGSGDSYWVHRIESRAIAGGTQAHPVILMHNQPGGNPATVAALPAIISYYRSHGYMFVDLYAHGKPPSVTALSTRSGPTSGGTRVTITGRDFRGVRKVTFSSTAGTSLHVSSSTSLSVTAPAHAAGVVGVRVTTTVGTSAPVAAATFRYVAPPVVTAVSPNAGDVAGGVRVRVTGSNFVSVTGVRFGTVAGTALQVSSSGTIYITAPAHAAGLVDIRVTTAYGVSSVASVDRFAYVIPPAGTG